MNNIKKLNWFQLMWKNHYIQLFIVFTFALITVLVNFNSVDHVGGFVSLLFCLILPIVLIIYYGFYKYWKYYKSLK